jgi:hypothetical protein
VAVEAAEGANGAARAPRRRRSRARRPRSASGLAAGASTDAGGNGADIDGAHEGEAPDLGDHADADHVESYGASHEQDHDQARSAAPAEKSEPASAPPARDEDTGPFSFFSWMRREPDKK